jgi:hypothetical protein
MAVRILIHLLFFLFLDVFPPIRIHPVTRDHLINEIFAPIYHNSPKSSHGEETNLQTRPESHDLALLFMVFSLATLLDLTRPPNNAEAEFYQQLARAGLSCDSVLIEPTLPAIQTLVCISLIFCVAIRTDPGTHCYRFSCRTIIG